MTTNTPDLSKYLAEVQAKALSLSGLIKAIAHLENEGGCAEGRAALTYLAEPMANEIFLALDSLHLPKGAL